MHSHHTYPTIFYYTQALLRGVSVTVLVWKIQSASRSVLSLSIRPLRPPPRWQIFDAFVLEINVVCKRTVAVFNKTLRRTWHHSMSPARSSRPTNHAPVVVVGVAFVDKLTNETLRVTSVRASGWMGRWLSYDFERRSRNKAFLYTQHAADARACLPCENASPSTSTQYVPAVFRA